MAGFTVIWDWNGTLLNDLHLCIRSINSLLEIRKLPLLTSKAYRDVFSFPIRDYYKAIGFDLDTEDFAVPANEFIGLYEAGVGNCSLHEQAMDVLVSFRERGYRQFVLSAMHIEMLELTLKHNGIYHFFEDVAGLNDHYAVSKVELGLQLIEKHRLDAWNTIMIGDTDHDFEVARAMGITCILVADGHQSVQRLVNTGAPVIQNLSELLVSDLTIHFR